MNLMEEVMHISMLTISSPFKRSKRNNWIQTWTLLRPSSLSCKNISPRRPCWLCHLFSRAGMNICLPSAESVELLRLLQLAWVSRWPHQVSRSLLNLMVKLRWSDQWTGLPQELMWTQAAFSLSNRYQTWIWWRFANLSEIYSMKKVWSATLLSILFPSLTQLRQVRIPCSGQSILIATWLTTLHLAFSSTSWW